MSRFQYPPNTRTIRVLCTGQVDATYILKALRNGADGVIVIGCRLGECHYIDGNLHARWKVDLVRRMLKRIDISPERTEIKYVSSAEGNKYLEVVNKFISKIKSLGPSPVNTKEDAERLKKMIGILTAAASDYRIRSIIAKKQKLTEIGNVYNEKISKEEFDRFIDEALYEEFIRQTIVTYVKEKPLSCQEIAEKAKLSSSLVLYHITYLRKQNIIDVDRIEGIVPLYKVL